MKRVNQLLLAFVILGTTTMISCKEKGCTDINANNYNQEAKKGDGYFS